MDFMLNLPFHHPNGHAQEVNEVRNKSIGVLESPFQKLVWKENFAFRYENYIILDLILT